MDENILTLFHNFFDEVEKDIEISNNTSMGVYVKWWTISSYSNRKPKICKLAVVFMVIFRVQSLTINNMPNTMFIESIHVRSWRMTSNINFAPSFWMGPDDIWLSIRIHLLNLPSQIYYGTLIIVIIVVHIFFRLILDILVTDLLFHLINLCNNN
mgnify:FL=1